MKNLVTLIIKNQRQFNFKVDDVENYNDFSNLKVNYHFKNTEVELFDDFLIEGIRTFERVLQRCLNGKMILPQKYFERGIGYEWNIISNNIAEGDFSIENVNDPFLLWDANPNVGLATWMYNCKGQTYFEVSQEYKYNYSEPDENFVPFQVFLENYEIVDRIAIDKEMLLQWYKEVKKILDSLK